MKICLDAGHYAKYNRQNLGFHELSPSNLI